MQRMSKRSTCVAVACLFALGTFAGTAHAAVSDGQPKDHVTADSATRQRLLQIPLSFESNRGQTDSAVKFLAHGDGYALFLTSKDAVFDLAKKSGAGNAPSVVRMRFVGANESALVSGVDRLPGTANYFVGSDAKKWHAGVPTYGKVSYRGIFPGIDAVFYGNQRELEYDFVVAPGADPGRIDMEFTGTTPKLDPAGNVLLSLDGENVVLRKPVLYQGEGSGRKPVDGGYAVVGNRVHMKVGAYDRAKPLVIDPVISYLTYLGGSTGTNNNGIPAVTSVGCRPNACPPGFSTQRGQGIAVDSSGNVYVTGQTWAVDFPTQSPLQSSNKSPTQWTAYVTKLNADGSGLVYSTYLGGSVNDEADAIALDAGGNAYVVGSTFSGDFPTTPGAYIATCPIQGGTTTYCQTNGASFLTKLSPDGQSLVYSTYVTTLLNAGTIRSVAVDSQGRAYVAGDNITYGNSASSNPPSTFFPTTANALQSSSLVDQAVHPGTSNPGMAFLTVFSADGSGLLYSTLFGDSSPVDHVNHGANFTRAAGVAVDPSGNFYLACWTADAYIPVTPNAFQTTYVAFLTASRSCVAKFSSVDSAGGPQLLYSTYLGAMNADLNASDQIAGITADANGNAYVTGYTANPGFPTTSGAYNPGPCGLLNPGGTCSNGAFLTKLTPDGSGLVWSTLIGYGIGGAGGYTGISAILPPRLDTRGNVYVQIQASNGYPVVNPAQIPGAGAVAVGITKFDPTGSKAYFSTLLGGEIGGAIGSAQFPAGIEVDAQGNIYVAGMTDRGDLPATAGAFQPTFPLTSQNYSAFIAKIDPFVADATTLAISPGSASVGQSVSFTATVNTNGAGAATGMVNFMNGTTLLGTGTVNAQGVATFSSSTLAAGTYNVTAAYQGDDTFAKSTSAAQNLTVGLASQTITFPSLAGVKYGAAPIALSATASSGLPINYGVTGPATLNGSTLTITGVGTVSVTASQDGNDSYLAASPVIQSFTVAPATLTVTATSASIGYGQAIPALTYTATGFVNGDTSAVLSGSPQETTTATSASGAGTYPITIAAGTLAAANYTFVFVNGTLTIGGGATQTITFSALPNVTYGVASITLTATASSGLPVGYSVTGPATLSGSTLTVTGIGTVNVTASQAGNANYGAASPVTRSFTVAPATLTVTATSATIGYGQSIPALTYSATGFVNGDTSAVLSGSPQETTTATSASGAGAYPITIAKGTLAAANYTFAFVNGTLTITGGATQTITFGALPNVTYGMAPITLTATASSGLPVGYSVTGPATLSGSTLTVTGIGTVNVTASQAGNANYGAASPVTRSFTVAPATLTVTATSASIGYGQAIPALTYTATGFVNGDTTAVLSGSPQETTTATSASPAGTYPIAIAKGTLAAANYTFVFVNGTLTITGGAASQTITFGAIPAQLVGVTINLTASASSGLPVSFASLSPSSCTVTGTTAYMLAVGACSIQATQPGNANYLAAIPVTRTFSVMAPPVATFTIDPDPPREAVAAGQWAYFLVDVRSVDRFRGSVKLACSGGPAGSQCAVEPQAVYLNGRALAVAWIHVPKEARSGNYTVTFTGTSGSTTTTATAQLSVK